jgi:nitrite reductase/ring-hydroxylating ferredoxin subunit
VSDDPTLSPLASAANGTAPDAVTDWVHVAEMRDLARRKRKQVDLGGCAIGLFLVDGEVFAVDDTCIHQERSLTKGTVLNGQVICPGHQWKFDPSTGEPEDQGGRLATYAVQVTEEGAILVGREPVTRRVPTTSPSAASNASLGK